MSELLGALSGLVEAGTKFLVERGRQRKVFLDEVVQPMHGVFEHMYRDHVATFGEVRSMLVNGKHSGHDIANLIQTRIIVEHGEIALLVRWTHVDSVNDWRRIPEHRDVAMLFRTYVISIANALVTDQREPASVVYYMSLADLASRAATAGPTSPDAGTRADLVHELDRMLRRLHAYHVEVQTAYAMLRRECLA